MNANDCTGAVVIPFPSRAKSQTIAINTPLVIERDPLPGHYIAPSYMALPFITPKPDVPLPTWPGDATSLWNDVPTDDYKADRKRGKQYARQMIAAIGEDQCAPHVLRDTLEAIVKDSVRRYIKGGKGSRILPGAAAAFLHEVANLAVLAARAVGRPSE